MIPTPHNVTTGWHSASQPAPLVYSLSDGVEKHTFALKTQQGGKPGKVYVKGVGYRKIRKYKNGKRYVLIGGKKIKLEK